MVIVEPTGFADGWMWSIEKGAKGGLQGFSLGGGVLSAGTGGRSGLTGAGSQCSVQDTDKFALSVRQLHADGGKAPILGSEAEGSGLELEIWELSAYRWSLKPLQD